MQSNWKLFLTMLKISATTFGGGFVIVPLLKNKFVDEEKLIDEDEMLELTAIAQSCSGPIAVNASIMVGYRVAGVRGVFIALFATVIPPLVIISVISLFYSAFRNSSMIKTIMAGMLCGVSAVIIDVVIQMIQKLNKSLITILMLIAAFIMTVFFKINVIYLIVAAVMIGIVTGGMNCK